jgi:S-adenosylmethionine:tRNA ribosyltransferase-isomerase
MKVSDYNYNLPEELISTHPAKPRDHSRLLIMDRVSGKLEHKKFFDILDYLQKGDVLVFNNSRVIPARLIGEKKNSGGKVEIFLHKRIDSDEFETWECLVGGRRIKIGLEIVFKETLACTIVKNNEDGTWVVEFNKKRQEFLEIIETVGQIPLPPYIEKQREEKQLESDKEDYQTIYADEKKRGSVAAPTAGLHFTPELMLKIRDKGVKIEYVTLHVGMGTFAPVKVEDAEKHKMHAEWVEISSETIDRLYNAKKSGRRIIAVGTTSTRSLEALASKFPVSNSSCPLSAPVPTSTFSEDVDIFIYPGYKFKLVDAMITNFHLPKSTLLMLVSALSSKENIDKAYAEAIKEKYRFYSYGDAMFIK